MTYNAYHDTTTFPEEGTIWKYRKRATTDQGYRPAPEGRKNQPKATVICCEPVAEFGRKIVVEINGEKRFMHRTDFLNNYEPYVPVKYAVAYVYPLKPAAERFLVGYQYDRLDAALTCYNGEVTGNCASWRAVGVVKIQDGKTEFV